MEGVKFEFYRGRTYVRNFTLIGWSPQINQVYFTVKSSEEDKSYILQKTLGNGIINLKTDFNENGKVVRDYNLTVEATDTDNMEIDKNYVFDIAIISGKIKQTVITGTVRLLGTATRTNNEKEAV